MRSAITETIQVHARDITVSGRNPRRHPVRQKGYVESSIERHGLVVPLVAYRRHDELVLINGHQRLEIAAPHDLLDVSVVDVTEEQAMELMLVLDEVSAYAELDRDAVAALLEVIDASDDGFGDLLERIARDNRVAFETLSDPDEVPAGVQSRTQPGDVFLLGKHRLLCADATLIESYERLFAGCERAVMCFTDPPYGVKIGADSNPRHRQRKGLANDDLPEAEFAAFLKAFIGACASYIEGDLYACMASARWALFDSLLTQAGYHRGSIIAWVKDSFVMGRSNYQRRFEPIFYGWRGHSSWCGRRDQDDVWEIARPRVSKQHPTMKPVGLVTRAIQNSSHRGDGVLDPFCGSGTTIIAAEQTGRRGFGIEIDPQFCDVTIARFEQLTGEVAELEGGRS